ncbi:MAG: GTP cyclohydrolase I [Chromatiales bacterium]|nr:GTP cyclohydrolase I [Chromatiales bacterium]
MFALRLHVKERMTNQVVDSFMKYLNATGISVVV